MSLQVSWKESQIAAAQLATLKKHLTECVHLLFALLDTDFKLQFGFESSTNWPMLSVHLIELLNELDDTQYRELTKRVAGALEKVEPIEQFRPFVAESLALVGETDGEFFQSFLAELLQSQSVSGSVGFLTGYVHLGDHFSTLWAIKLLALAGETGRQRSLIEKATDLLIADLDVWSNRESHLGYLLYDLYLIRQVCARGEAEKQVVDLLLNSRTHWQKNREGLVSAGYVAFDLLLVSDDYPNVIPAVEDWLIETFDLDIKTPERIPSIFDDAMSAHQDVWLQGWIRALIAATRYIRKREPNYSPVSDALIRYVHTCTAALFRESQNRYLGSQLEDLQKMRERQEMQGIRERPSAEIIKQFKADHNAKFIVFVMMRLEGTDTLENLYENLSKVVEEKGGKVVRTGPRKYVDELWSNVKVYMYGANYGIAIFDSASTRLTNMCIETAYMKALGKKVLMLMDKNVTWGDVASDFTGTLYEEFDSQRTNTIIEPVQQWIENNVLPEVNTE